MKLAVKSKKQIPLKIAGREFTVDVIEIPFREGVELCCVVDGEELRVSDRQLGEREALRILSELIQTKITNAS